MRIFGVVLAGGTGQRMGGVDKAFLPLAGRSLILHVLDRFEPQVERLAISANGDPARFAAFGLKVLPDAEILGPLAGILAAMAWASEQGADAVVSAPVDGPFLPPDLVPRLCLASDHGKIAVAQCGGIRGGSGLGASICPDARTPWARTGVAADIGANGPGRFDFGRRIQAGRAPKDRSMAARNRARYDPTPRHLGARGGHGRSWLGAAWRADP